MIINLIRHGQTRANDESLFCGSGLDFPLTEKGRKEIESLKADGIYPGDVEYCFVSELTRARQTREIIYPSVPYEVNPLFNEFHMGTLEGTDIQTLLRVHDIYTSDIYAFTAEGISDPEAFRQQVFKALDYVTQVCSEKGYEHAAIISHRIFAQQVILNFLNGALDRNVDFDNGEGLILEALKDGGGYRFRFLDFIRRKR